MTEVIPGVLRLLADNPGPMTLSGTCTYLLGAETVTIVDPGPAGQQQMGLLSAGLSDSISVVRGVNYLLRHQRPDGSWQEVSHTGTGFPLVFYLRYHWYCQYFPLWALAMYRNIRARGQARADELRKVTRETGRFRTDS